MPGFIVGLAIASPILLQMLIFDNIKKLHENDFKTKYQALYNQCNSVSRSSLMNIGVYFLRRFIFVSAIVLLDDYYALSLMLVTLSNLAILLYLVSVKPFLSA